MMVPLMKKAVIRCAKPGILHALSFLLLAATFVLSSCHDSVSVYSNPTDPTSSKTGAIAGKVLLANGSFAVGVEVTVGTLHAITDTRGEFILNSVPVSSRVLVTFSGALYATTQKITIVREGKTSLVTASVSYFGTETTVNASTGCTVTTQNAKVVIPANAVVDGNGAAFTGSMKVRATWYDPTGKQFTEMFPGDFAGVRTDNTETAIESFGFMSVELLNGSEKLQIAPGKEATLTFPVPSSLRSKAPATIPLWYYNETTGKWMEEGSATFNGTAYVGNVKHFSAWNCDQPSATSYLEGNVVDNNGKPMPMARVCAAGLDYSGSSWVYTNDSGYFKIAVKASSQVKVTAAYYFIGSTPSTYATPAVGQTQNIGTITIPVDSMSVCNIVGTVVDNGGNPISYIIAILSDANGKTLEMIATQNGSFKFFGEKGKSYSVFVAPDCDSSSGVKVNFTCPTTSQTIDLGNITIDIGGAYVTGRCVDSTTGNPLQHVVIWSLESARAGREKGYVYTDANGRFTLWVRPNKTFDITATYQQMYQRNLTVTSGALGTTTDIGNIVMPN